MTRKFNFWLATMLCAALAALGAACKAGDGAGTQRAGATTTTTAPSAAGAAAPGATPHPTSTPQDGVRRLSVEESQAMAERGEAIIVDVRAKTQYDQSHIKGSLSLPRTELDRRVAELPKDKLIIFYCA